MSLCLTNIRSRSGLLSAIVYWNRPDSNAIPRRVSQYMLFNNFPKISFFLITYLQNLSDTFVQHNTENI